MWARYFSDRYISLTFYDANCKKKLQGDNTSKQKSTTENMHRNKQAMYTTADTDNSIKMTPLYRSSVIDCKVKLKSAAREAKNNKRCKFTHCETEICTLSPLTWTENIQQSLLSLLQIATNVMSRSAVRRMEGNLNSFLIGWSTRDVA